MLILAYSCKHICKCNIIVATSDEINIWCCVYEQQRDKLDNQSNKFAWYLVNVTTEIWNDSFSNPGNAGSKVAHVKYLLYYIKVKIGYNFLMLSTHAILESENLCLKGNKTHQ